MTIRAFLFALLCSSCGGAPSALGEYLHGVEDGVLESGTREPPTIVIDWNKASGPLGTCRKTEAGKVVTIYVSRILAAARTVQEGRDLLRDVVAHELVHAAFSCTDADHEAIP